MTRKTLCLENCKFAQIFRTEILTITYAHAFFFCPKTTFESADVQSVYADLKNAYKRLGCPCTHHPGRSPGEQGSAQSLTADTGTSRVELRSGSGNKALQLRTQLSTRGLPSPPSALGPAGKMSNLTPQVNCAFGLVTQNRIYGVPGRWHC